MKTIRYILLVTVCLLTKAQNVVLSSEPAYPKELNEKIVLFTDRNVYSVGETVCFKALNNSHYLVKEKNWSKVLYVELLNSEGVPAFKGKFRLSATGAEGTIMIPLQLQTDNYYLVAYTKWMRNFSPLEFAFIRLCIINPIKAPKENNRNKGDSIKANPNNLPEKLSKINCYMNESTYSKREKVSVSFRFPKSRDTSACSYCVSVVKKAAIDLVDFGTIHSGISISGNIIVNNFIPEINGPTISGRIVGVDDSVSYPGIKIQLSDLGSHFDYYNSESDTEGKFIFSLRQKCNKNDMYISCEKSSQLPLKILIDDEYYSGTFLFRGYPFVLSEEEERIAEEVMFNMQVNRIFNSLAEQHTCKDTNTSYFYGSPTKTVYIDDFIQLPNLSEIFFELIPEVLIQRKKEKTIVQVKGRNENLNEFQLYEPLVLVDRIPITSIDDVLNIPPTRISRIELVNEIYIKGDHKYGGIISVYSKKGDLAGIRLPDNSMFFNFNGLAISSKADEYDPANLQPHQPDYRNNLFWEPNLIAKPGTETRVEFHTSDVTGDYVVLVRGLTEVGDIITGKIEFQVK